MAIYYLIGYQITIEKDIKMLSRDHFSERLRAIIFKFIKYPIGLLFIFFNSNGFNKSNRAFFRASIYHYFQFKS